MKKKTMIAIAVAVLIIVAVLAVNMVKQFTAVVESDAVRTEDAAAQVTVDEAAADAASEEEVFEVAELYGTVTEVTEQHIMLDVQQMGAVQVFITDDTLIEGVETIEVGQVVKVIYDGKMTRSIPAQVTAMLIGVYVVEGEVKSVEDGRMTVVRAAEQDEVIISLPEGVQVSAGEKITAYTDGVMTMSLPPQMNAIAVIK